MRSIKPGVEKLLGNVKTREEDYRANTKLEEVFEKLQMKAKTKSCTNFKQVFEF